MPGPHGFAVRSFLRQTFQPASAGCQILAAAFKRRSSARRARSRMPALRTPFAPDAAASTATRPNVSDDGQRPSSLDGMAGVVGVIWVCAKRFIFAPRLDGANQFEVAEKSRIGAAPGEEQDNHPLSRSSADAVECTPVDNVALTRFVLFPATVFEPRPELHRLLDREGQLDDLQCT